ncbi:MAG: hypothetical protein JWP34_4678 [Massilia sp.]|nr:hypothetical protein [Massilia sp.]
MSSRSYTVSSVAAGQEFADFLWSAYGPVDPNWTGARPFGDNVIDGFDFDIETKFDDQSGYIALIDRLRGHIAAAGGSQVISGAPQCPLSPALYFDMDQMITQAQFDLLWIQFYNNPGCDYVVGNASPESPTGNFNEWQSYIAGTASSAAKLFIGLPGASSSGYVDPAVAYQLMQDTKAQPSFGGAMVWDASSGGSNVLPNGRNYYENLHDALNNVVVAVPTTTTTTSATATPTAGCTQVTVQPGDYCWLIATNNGLTVSQLEALNPGLDCETTPIQPGQVFTVSGVCPATTTTTSTTTTSTTSTTTTSSTTTTESSASSSQTSTSCSETSTSVSETSTETETSTAIATTTSVSTSTSTTIDVSTTTSSTSVGIPLSTGTSPGGSSITISGPYGNGTTTDSATSTALSGTAPLTTGSSGYSTTLSAPYGNATSTETATSSTSLSGPTSSLPPYSNSTITTGGQTLPTQTGSPTQTGVTDSASLTTSTLYTTTVHTITSCAATVTNCPVGSVTTETVVIGTTVCPVVDVTATVVPVTTPPAGSGSGSGEWTTSTVYTTTVYTVTACPASVPNCPGKGSVTTEVVPAYTTVCPVTQGNGKPTGGAGEGLPKPTGGIKEQGGSTTKTTSTGYTFVTVPSKGPSAGAPAPSGSKGPSAGVPAPSGNGTSLVISYTVKPTGATLPTGSASATPTKVVTAGAGRNGVALGLAGLIAAAVMLL